MYKITAIKNGKPIEKIIHLECNKDGQITSIHYFDPITGKPTWSFVNGYSYGRSRSTDIREDLDKFIIEEV